MAGFPGTLWTVAAGVMIAGCVATAQDRPLRGEAPPPPRVEQRPEPPAPGMVWIPGSWHWNGVDHVWLPGHWEAPRPVPGG